MAKLKMLKPVVATMAPRIATFREVRDRGYSPDAKVRGWYKSKRWQDLRLEAFQRDLWRCQRTGQLCVAKHPAPDSPVANHKVPHKGDPALFWDLNNIETVSKAVHDSDIQSEERRGAAL